MGTKEQVTLDTGYRIFDAGDRRQETEEGGRWGCRNAEFRPPDL